MTLPVRLNSLRALPGPMIPGTRLDSDSGGGGYLAISVAFLQARGIAKWEGSSMKSAAAFGFVMAASWH